MYNLSAGEVGWLPGQLAGTLGWLPGQLARTLGWLPAQPARTLGWLPGQLAGTLGWLPDQPAEGCPPRVRYPVPAILVLSSGFTKATEIVKMCTHQTYSYFRIFVVSYVTETLISDA